MPVPRDNTAWSDSEYLSLQERTNRLVELVDGHVEALDRPTKSHQLILKHCFDQLESFTRDGIGKLVNSGYPIRIRPGRFRTPDVVFMLTSHAERLGEHYAHGADLVMEVLATDRNRDLVQKREDYAEAGIPEYWIVDPRDRRVTVLRLEGGEYLVHGEFGLGGRATSVLLSGFGVDVREVFAAGGITS